MTDFKITTQFAGDFAADILDFFDTSKRDLPWRHTRDPYARWVSEIMLQQTRVATVIPYYQRWLQRFPTVLALANAKEEDVLNHWSGLGYYRRAKNLQKGARVVRDQFSSKMPTSHDQLLTIPGIGRYTAGAVASMSFDEVVPIVDGNVARVFARMFAITEDVTVPATQKKLWQVAEALVPTRRPGDYNEGLMELGAIVCTPKSPTCLTCSVRRLCLGQKKGLAGELPNRGSRRGRQKTKIHEVAVAMRNKRAELLLAQRAGKGLYSGLWELPAMTSIGALQDELRVPVLASEKILTSSHELTHLRITTTVWSGNLGGKKRRPAGDRYQKLAWYSAEDLISGNIPISSSTKKMLQTILDND